VKKGKLVIVIIILFILGGLAALTWESIIYVSSIKGKVVDAETGQPMKGVNVRAGWVTGYADPGGGHFKTFKVYATKTDANGDFVLPRTIKLKIPIIERYQGVNMLIYEHGYVCQEIVRRAWLEGGKIKYYQIALRTIKNDEEFNENLRRLSYHLSSDIDKYYDLKFVVDDFKIFFEKYPDSRFVEENYWKLAGFYEREMKDYQSALRVNEEFVKKFPKSPVSNSVRDDIQRLKRVIQSFPKKENKNEK